MNIRVKLLVLFVTSSIIWFHVGISGSQRFPVVLVGGYTAGQLVYSLEPGFDFNFVCKLPLVFNKKYLWFNILNYIPGFDKCWYRYAKLDYDQRTRTSFSSEGVQVSPPSFGPTEPLEFIAPFPQQIPMTSYYFAIVEKLVQNGYTRDVNVKGAPYDWRKAPNEQQIYFIQLKQLVESTYVDNGNKPVIILSHSLGCRMSYIFLKRQSLEWKRKHIKAFIALAPSCGGHFKYWYGYLFNDDDPVTKLIPIVRDAQRTFPSMAFLMPNERFWSNQVFIWTPEKNYTASDYKLFFNKIGNPNAYEMHLDTKDSLGDLSSPEVNTYIIGGHGQKTLKGLVYSTNNFESQPQIIYGDGDESVLTEALNACRSWNSSSYEFSFRTMNSSHTGLVRDERPVEEVVRLVLDMV